MAQFRQQGEDPVLHLVGNQVSNPLVPTSTTTWVSSGAAATIPTRASRARGSMTCFYDSFRWVALSWG